MDVISREICIMPTRILDAFANISGIYQDTCRHRNVALEVSSIIEDVFTLGKRIVKHSKDLRTHFDDPKVGSTARDTRCFTVDLPSTKRVADDARL
ncbi:hypothetical protein CY34DRAFT_245503 [Suillus luteus UH-Slu-Lm8-n1]|uniref:Uncharacterized protein n=1 Tax=Suillus luteus UH-Slu-Lm8-n1 TaxID=930992 RepID=A0A0D0B2S7_9AGAM|nr:hypothetical protein CY34DRAFT_245503 [Suillus luteus UH-Slu-Lm8-n1]